MRELGWADLNVELTGQVEHREQIGVEEVVMADDLVARRSRSPGSPRARSRPRRQACTSRTPRSRSPCRATRRDPLHPRPSPTNHRPISTGPRNQKSYGGIDMTASSRRSDTSDVMS